MRLVRLAKKVLVHEENQRREGGGGKKRRAFLLSRSIEKSPVDPDPTI